MRDINYWHTSNEHHHHIHNDGRAQEACISTTTTTSDWRCSVVYIATSTAKQEYPQYDTIPPPPSTTQNFLYCL